MLPTKQVRSLSDQNNNNWFILNSKKEMGNEKALGGRWDNQSINVKTPFHLRRNERKNMRRWQSLRVSQVLGSLTYLIVSYIRSGHLGIMC